MSRCTLIIALMVAMTLVAHTEAISCYVCKNTTTPSCAAVPFNPEGIATQSGFDYCGTCFASSSGVTEFTRRGGQGSDANGCATVDPPGGKFAFNYQFVGKACYTNLCNSAHHLQPLGVALGFLFLLCIGFIL